MDIVGIILGAGASRRLGRPKQTLPLGEQTVLGRSVAAARESRLHRVIVILGGARDDVTDNVDLVGVETADNTSYGSGCASSLLAGLDAAGPVDGIVMLLGDMPTLSPKIINTMIGHVGRHRPWAAVTSYRGRLGHPFYFSAASFDVLRSLHGDKAVWKIVEREPDTRVHRVHVDSDVPLDIDTWEDYRRVLAMLSLEAPAGIIP